MKPDAFKPQGKQISVQGAEPARQLGQEFRISAQPHQVQAPPMSVHQGGDRFSPASGGVQLSGAQRQVQQQPQRVGSFQPAQTQESVQQQLSARQISIGATHHHQQQQAPQRNETFAVYLDGVGPDGTPLSTDAIMAQFPAGSVLSGLRYERVE
jgi:hypothetical protein